MLACLIKVLTRSFAPFLSFCLTSPDTKYIYINVGFGFHVQMTLKEALTFIDKKNTQLQTRAEKHTEEAAKIRANIKLVCAFAQLRNLTLSY